MTIREQIEAATKDVRQIEERLTAAGHASAARRRQDVRSSLPATIDSAAISPVHHPTVICRWLLDVAEGDGLGADTRVLLLAILCHDAFLGAAEGLSRFSCRWKPPVKTRASDVRKADGERKQHLVRRGMLEHTLHNEEAARRARCAHRRERSEWRGVAPGEIEMIRSIVARHDLPSVAQLKHEAGEQVGRQDLFGPTERLALLFRSLIDLWMVTPEGIDVDVQRTWQPVIRGQSRCPAP